MGNIVKYVTHGRKVQRLAARFGWLPGARYTNLRDVRTLGRLGFLDIDWQNYDYERHLDTAKNTQPILTIAQDVVSVSQLSSILEQAYSLLEYCDNVAIVPKDKKMENELEDLVPRDFVLGYSVPTRYGGTEVSPKSFRRKVHLLGGRPDVQRRLAQEMNVVSVDINRFTFDATFGDYFDGEIFRPHPIGGYEKCLVDSIRNINRIWEDYRGARSHSLK